METRPLICYANQWTGFYMLKTTVMKELRPCKVWLENKLIFIKTTEQMVQSPKMTFDK